MPLSFAAAAVHAPGITGRPQMATERQRAVLFPAYEQLRERLEQARLEALVMVSAEHFTNFFMDNMPAFCFGLAEAYPGPSEDEPFLKIPKTRVPGAARLARALATAVSEDADIAHSEELTLACGKRFRVKNRVDRLIDEKTGRMIELKNDCIVLDGFVCTGDQSASGLFCPREAYPIFREAWLRRIGDAEPHSPEEVPALGSENPA